MKILVRKDGGLFFFLMDMDMDRASKMGGGGVYQDQKGVEGVPGSQPQNKLIANIFRLSRAP